MKKTMMCFAIMFVFLILGVNGFAQESASSQSKISLDNVMTKEYQARIGVNKLTSSERKALEEYIKSIFVYFTNSEYQGINESHWISEKVSVVRLEDGSLWGISPFDKIYSDLWLVTEKVVVVKNDNSLFPYKVIKINPSYSIRKSEVVEAKYLGNR